MVRASTWDQPPQAATMATVQFLCLILYWQPPLRNECVPYKAQDFYPRAWRSVVSARLSKLLVCSQVWVSGESRDQMWNKHTMGSERMAPCLLTLRKREPFNSTSFGYNRARRIIIRIGQIFGSSSFAKSLQLWRTPVCVDFWVLSLTSIYSASRVNCKLAWNNVWEGPTVEHTFTRDNVNAFKLEFDGFFNAQKHEKCH